MIYSETEAYMKVENWLASSGVEKQSGKILDPRGCCCVTLDDDKECLIMLPTNQTNLYFITELYSPDPHQDIDMLIHCLTSNCIDMVLLEGACIGLDADNRKLILRKSYPLYYGSETQFDAWLKSVQQQTEQVKEQIQLFFHAKVSSRPVAPEGRQMRL